MLGSSGGTARDSFGRRLRLLGIGIAMPYKRAWPNNASKRRNVVFVTMPLLLGIILIYSPECFYFLEIPRTHPSPQSIEASYRYINYVGNRSAVQTRSCGVVQGLRRNTTVLHAYHPRLVIYDGMQLVCCHAAIGARLGTLYFCASQPHTHADMIAQVRLYKITMCGHPQLQVIDTVPFNNEYELMHARFLEYWDVVDLFVVTEAALNFMGNPKPLNFGIEICGRFAPFAAKIVHVEINGSMRTGDEWLFEHLHRDAFAHVGTLLGLHRDDVLLSADADEIPYASSVVRAANTVWNARAANPLIFPVVDFHLILYYNSLYHRSQTQWTHHNKMYNFGLAQEVQSISKLRFSKAAESYPHASAKLIETIPDAGIHPSYCFTIKDIIGKFRSYSHAPDYADKSDEQLTDMIMKHVKYNKSWLGQEHDGPLRDPRTNPDLFGFNPEARELLIEWTETLHAEQLGTAASPTAA